MRLKTFLSTYLLFLCILYVSLGIVSVYMSNSQMNMLKEKSVGEYHTIAASLARDIAVIYGRSEEFNESVNSLTNGYARYYKNYGIVITLNELALLENEWEKLTNNEIVFSKQGREHFIRIAGTLPEPFQYYLLEYSLNISKTVENMQGIQRVLLIFAIIFSVVTAITLHFILAGIFKPLSIVTNASRKIANGGYSERIRIKGKNEISSMAQNFNRMAEEIEKQIHCLEQEAITKQQFADNLAHEIRTPLTSVYGYAEYMQKAALTEEEIIESAGYIMDEAGHMKNIANSLLELATLRNYKPIKNEISIARLFDDMSRSMEKLLQQQNVRLDCHNTADILFGQEDLIKSLLVNLCSNAIKSCTPVSALFI